jgi:hypothetical protein
MTFAHAIRVYILASLALSGFLAGAYYLRPVFVLQTLPYVLAACITRVYWIFEWAVKDTGISAVLLSFQFLVQCVIVLIGVPVFVFCFVVSV